MVSGGLTWLCGMYSYWLLVVTDCCICLCFEVVIAPLSLHYLL